MKSNIVRRATPQEIVDALKNRKGRKFTQYFLEKDNQPSTPTLRTMIIVLGAQSGLRSIFTKQGIDADILVLPNPIAKSFNGKMRYILKGTGSASFDVQNDGTNIRLQVYITETNNLIFKLLQYSPVKYSPTVLKKSHKEILDNRKTNRLHARYPFIKQPYQKQGIFKPMPTMKWRHNGKRHQHYNPDMDVAGWGISQDYIMIR